MNACSEAASSTGASETPFDFEATFRAQYERVARVIRRVVHDPARAEELAVEVFLKLWRSPKAQGDKTEAWLYRSAVRKGLDELRRRTRRVRYESLFGFVRTVPNPEEIRAANEEQERVRWVLCYPASPCRAAGSSQSRPQLRRIGIRSRSESGFDRYSSKPRAASVPKGIHQKIWPTITNCKRAAGWTNI